jgi:uncharacterized protein YjiS (DUF1127 family)
MRDDLNFLAWYVTAVPDYRADLAMRCAAVTHPSASRRRRDITDRHICEASTCTQLAGTPLSSREGLFQDGGRNEMRSKWAKLRATVRLVRKFLSDVRRRAHERAALASMTDRELRDFGANRYEVAQELRKPLWRP